MVTQQAPVLTLGDRVESVFELTPKELERYSRQIMLPNFGVEAQRKLKSATVLVTGVGGLGGSLALMKTGESGRILRFGRMDDRTASQLKTMGLAPGVSLKLEQRSPSFIVKVGNTCLRLSDTMRRSIYVRII